MNVKSLIYIYIKEIDCLLMFVRCTAQTRKRIFRAMASATGEKRT